VDGWLDYFHEFGCLSEEELLGELKAASLMASSGSSSDSKAPDADAPKFEVVVGDVAGPDGSDATSTTGVHPARALAEALPAAMVVSDRDVDALQAVSRVSSALEK
jgi:MoxR-like ATPase